jgi:hypothetical protein
MKLVRFVDAHGGEAVWINPESVSLVSSVRDRKDRARVYYGRDYLEVEGAPGEIVDRLAEPATAMTA